MFQLQLHPERVDLVFWMQDRLVQHCEQLEWLQNKQECVSKASCHVLRRDFGPFTEFTLFEDLCGNTGVGNRPSPSWTLQVVAQKSP